MPYQSTIFLLYLLVSSIAWSAALPVDKVDTPCTAPLAATDCDTTNMPIMSANFDKPLHKITNQPDNMSPLQNEYEGLQIVANFKQLREQQFSTMPQPTGLATLPSELMNIIIEEYLINDHMALAQLRRSCKYLHAISHNAWYKAIIERWGKTIAFEILQYGHDRVVQELLTAGVSSNSIHNGNPLLYEACRILGRNYDDENPKLSQLHRPRSTISKKCPRSKLITIIKNLLEAGANPNGPTFGKTVDLDQRTALFMAPLDVCQLLLDCQANINAQSRNGRTPLIEAACRGDRKKAQLLLKNNADTTMKHKGRTAEQWAMDYNWKMAADIQHFSLTGNLRDPIQDLQEKN